MDEFTWIKMTFLLIPALQITAAESEPHYPFHVVRDGNDVTLPCKNVRTRNCDGTTWVFSGLGKPAAVELIRLGQIGEDGEAKSDRLSLTAGCSLAIKKVTAEDVGHYSCQQHVSVKTPPQDTELDLCVINMTKQEASRKVTLKCNVLMRAPCRYKVKWLSEGEDGDDLKTSPPTCSAKMQIAPLQKYDSLKCEVTNTFTKITERFPFSPRSSAETTDWWWYIVVAVGSAALSVTAVGLVRWKRAKAKRTQMYDHVELTSTPAVAQCDPETSNHPQRSQADPEGDVSYASIAFTENSHSKDRVQRKAGAGDAVTYSTVKPSSSSSSAGAHTVSGDLYATIK